jgi:Sugar phosphate permease
MQYTYFHKYINFYRTSIVRNTARPILTRNRFSWIFILINFLSIFSGVIFGIWNSHTSIGNIMGAVIASHYLATDWSLSFIVPGIIIMVSGVVMFLFLPEYPSDVGCTTPKKSNGGVTPNIKCPTQPRVSEIIKSLIKNEGSYVFTLVTGH